MRCLYCEVEVTTYPENGICQHCGGQLPPKPAVTQAEQPPAQKIYVQPVYAARQEPLIAGVNCCPKCHCTKIVHGKRGFSWGLAILGFFLFPGLGCLLGFCGRKKPRIHCTKCGHMWKG